MNNNIRFLDHFTLLEDPRVPSYIQFPANELLLLTLCAVIADCNDWEEIYEYGTHNLEFLRTLLPFRNGIPCAMTMQRFFAAIDHEYFSICFTDWAASLSESVQGVVAIDGKTLRGSRSGDKKALHIVSAFCHAQGIVLSQQKVDDKSNEITAIPQLLEKLNIKGAIVTLDALGTQKDIAAKITKCGADYMLALKENQGTLFSDVKLFFDEHAGNNCKDSKIDIDIDVDSAHGRIETRKCIITDDIDWLKHLHPEWQNLNSIVKIESCREFKNKDKIETQSRYYIASIPASAKQAANAIRHHWSIENSLHWVMDVIFQDDASSTSTDNSAVNLHIVKQMALNMLKRKQEKKRKSIKCKRKVAGWNHSYLLDVLKS